MGNKAAELSEEEFLASYDASRYPKPSVTVDTVIFRQNGAEMQVLLIKRGNHPYRGFWALPGGFLNMDENLDAAAAREVQEETSLKLAALEEIGVYGAVGRDKRDRVITVAYAALLEENSEAKAGDDAADCAWFALQAEQVGNRLKIKLQKSSEVLRLEVVLQMSAFSKRLRSVEILASDLAFDHALILADGFLSVIEGVENNA